MADQRLKAIYDAASFLFITKGYANTQVSQIASAANIGTGTVYNLFSGKKSILHFVLMATFDKSYLDGEVGLPVKEVGDEIIIQRLSRIVEGLFLELESSSSFMELLSTLFDLASNYQVAFNIINDNRGSLVAVELEYRQAINRLYTLIGEQLSRYIECGEVRNVDFPELHVRNIIEGITWWSMYLPYQAVNTNVSIDRAKDIALDTLRHAYLTDPE